jgi:hypothetical protein
MGKLAVNFRKLITNKTAPALFINKKNFKNSQMSLSIISKLGI